MSIIISNGHRETAEVEFRGRHPDIFCSYLSAALVKRLAIESHRVGMLNEFRADLNVQLLGETVRKERATPIHINVGGQLIVPELPLEEVVREEAVALLQHAGYFDSGDFDKGAVTVNAHAVTSQSLHLNGVTKQNKFADTCVVYGHYLAPHVGEDGTFPSLVIAQSVDRAVDRIRREDIRELRPDGKVHITIERQSEGYTVTDVYLSVSHAKGADVSGRVASRLLEFFPFLQPAVIYVNTGGKFDVYFVQADAGVSKAKDDIVITGGIHQLGTDRVWGKCLHKASSTAIPYAFALSRVVSEATGARFASVSVYTQYGGEACAQLQEIDTFLESERGRINAALSHLPKTRDEIAALVGLGTTIESYRLFNDVGGFHTDKPWKMHNAELGERFKEHYTLPRSVIGGALK